MEVQQEARAPEPLLGPLYRLMEFRIGCLGPRRPLGRVLDRSVGVQLGPGAGGAGGGLPVQVVDHQVGHQACPLLHLCSDSPGEVQGVGVRPQEGLGEEIE